MFRFVLLTLLALPLAGPAPAQDRGPYRDDRSDPAAIVGSLYDAVDRHQYARAWSYFGDAKPTADYAAFVRGYADTDRVRVRIGPVISEGAAGSIYSTVAVAIEATDTTGHSRAFGGCYVTRQVQPAIQEPPFRPLQIVEGHLQPRPDFDAAMPAACDPDGRPQF
jgi:hypothetical protein